MELERHPNFLGFTIWRAAFVTAAGGWAIGYLFKKTSIPILEVRGGCRL